MTRRRRNNFAAAATMSSSSWRLLSCALLALWLFCGDGGQLVSSFQAPLLSRNAHLPTTRTTAGIHHRNAGRVLQLSLDDNWDELAQSIVHSKDRISEWASLQDLPKIVEKTSKSLRWETIFSKEWFDTVQSATYDVFGLFLALPWYAELSIVVFPFVVVMVGLVLKLSQPPTNYRNIMEPYERGNYDPVAAQAYYKNHPFLVAQRLLQILRLSNRYLLNIGYDKYILRDEEKNRKQRANELLELITKLGPTAIKVGQALSVRPDLVQEDYANALSTLQDQVPPFSNSNAKALLREQLGLDKYGHLGLEQKKPVASASIGQVYKGLLDDLEVAVKVQRPNVLSEIALDLYIVREFAPIYQKFTGGATDLQALANEWGRGFIAELDYRQEARATQRFNDEMQIRKLNAVCAPNVIKDYSTEQILVTEWVDGTRLDESDASDVPRLCAVALNAYLVMLLELKSLHCDPHPGNLLRTRDGRLCILDFGMTLDINPSLQYSLLEFVAHLTSEDYQSLPEDLAALGFLKPDKIEFAKRSGVLKPLEYFLKQAGQGGGADAVRNRIFDEYRAKYPGLSDDELRVEMRSEMKQQLSDMVERESVATGITVEVEELQKRNRDSFTIPEWFLYSSRAFLTLEGVSLQANPNYSLIQSCFPYVAKRLVGDDDPRARKALRDLLYGATDSVDVKRLTDLADGFTSYTTTTKTINQQAKSHDGEIILMNGEVERVSKDRERKNRMVEAEATITLAKDSADIFLAPEGNLVQNLFVEESALAASAQFKDSFRTTFLDGPKRFRESLPIIGAILPPLPFEDQVAPFLRKTEREIKAQQLTEKISAIAMSTNGATSQDGSEDTSTHATNAVLQSLRELEAEQAALVVKELRENLPRYGPLVGKLGSKFVSTLFNTASKNIETTLTELELAGEQPDELVRSTVKGLSSAAQNSAKAIYSGNAEERSSQKSANIATGMKSIN